MVHLVSWFHFRIGCKFPNSGRDGPPGRPAVQQSFTGDAIASLSCASPAGCQVSVVQPPDRPEVGPCLNEEPFVSVNIPQSLGTLLYSPEPTSTLGPPMIRASLMNTRPTAKASRMTTTDGSTACPDPGFFLLCFLASIDVIACCTSLKVSFRPLLSPRTSTLPAVFWTVDPIALSVDLSDAQGPIVIATNNRLPAITTGTTVLIRISRSPTANTSRSPPCRT